MLERSHHQPRHRRLGFGFIVALLAGLFGAVLALGHSAAALGIGLAPFRPLGGSFFSYKAGQAQYLQQLRSETDAASIRRALPFGRNILQNSPLSARAAWLIGVSLEAAGDRRGASAMMAQADRISRRESLPQSWLAQQALRNGDAPLAMKYLDVMLRTEPELKPEILPRMSGLLAAPEGAALFRKYAGPQTHWYPDFLKAAAETQTDARPVARFLLTKGAYLPRDSVSVEAYRLILRRLADAGDYPAMVSFYRKLPEARPVGLASLDLESANSAISYPPLDWEFVQSADRNASLVTLGEDSVGVEFSSGPGLVATLARKVLIVRDGASLNFDLISRTANDGSTAHWRASCVAGSGNSSATRSAELFAGEILRRIAFDMPARCQLVLIEFVMSGGVGRDVATMLVGNLDLKSGHSRPR